MLLMHRAEELLRKGYLPPDRQNVITMTTIAVITVSVAMVGAIVGYRMSDGLDAERVTALQTQVDSNKMEIVRGHKALAAEVERNHPR